MHQRSRPISILHVDDEPDFAEMAAAFLERQADALRVETATSAADALDLLEGKQFDCIVSDYDMPGQDGIELLTAIREDYPELPFILFTGHGSEEVASDAISAGVTDYMQKGAGSDQYEVLAQRVKNAVARHRVSEIANRSEAILEASPAAIVVEIGREIVYANPAAVSLAGAESAADLVGVDVTALTGPGEVDAVLEDIEAVESGRGTVDGVRRELRTLTGETLIAEITARSVTWEGKTGHVVIIRDVTELVASQRALEANEARFRNLAESATDAILTIGPDSRIRYANQAVERIFGYDPDDLTGEPLTQLMPERLRGHHLEALERYLRTGDPSLDWSDVRLPGRHRDGHELDLHISFSEYEGDDQTRFTAVIREVPDSSPSSVGTNLKRRYRALFEESPDGIVLYDGEGTILDANPRACENLRYRRDELVGMQIWDFSSVDRERVLAWLADLGPRETATFEGVHERSDGSTFPVQVHVAQLGEGTTNQFLGIVRDISEHKARERELERYETIVEALGDPVYALDADGRYTFVNDAFVSSSGYTRKEVLGEHVSVIVPEEYVEQGREIIVDLLAEENGTATWELERQTADGELVPAENHAALLPTDDGRFQGSAGVIRDITERKEREEELERHRRRVEIALRATDSYIFEIDPNSGQETRFGEWETLHGMSTADLPTTASFVDRAVHPADREEHRRAHRKLLSGEAESTVVEYRTNPTTGVQRWIRAEIHRQSDGSDGAARLVGLATDITSRKEREQRLERERDRLDEFASVVSHDLRNPLTVAYGRLELVADDGNLEHLDTVFQQLDRMETLVEDLLAVAREGGSVEDPETIDLSEIVPKCWATVETGDATLEIQTERSVQGDPGRLKQVFENLIGNAVEHGGDGTVTIGELNDGFYVEDDGPGIPATNREQLFEAGFSTSDGGTGFGLSIVREIVEAHGWTIEVTDGSAGGARFEITGVGRP